MQQQTVTVLDHEIDAKAIAVNGLPASIADSPGNTTYLPYIWAGA